MKILILAPYPPKKAPNQRFRFEQYLGIFSQNSIEYDYHPFWSEKVWDIFYQPGNFMLKTKGLITGIVRRFSLLRKLGKYEYIFIHRECMPVGPPVLEYIISRWYSKKIIYDFDDAIWIKNYSDANKFAAGLKYYQKVGAICRYSYKVSAGNHFLARYAQQYNRFVEVIPTTIDTVSHHNRIKEADDQHPLVIGWTGTHSTLIQIRQIAPQLEQLQQETDFLLHIICDEDPDFRNIRYRFIPWQQATEIDDLLIFDIGIMPLRNTDWERGKCGFKALQYMALGIPVVASAVGANNEILTHEHDSLLVSVDKPDDWVNHLRILLANKSERQRLGAEGRKTVESRYSVNSNKEKYLRLFSERH